MRRISRALFLLLPVLLALDLASAQIVDRGRFNGQPTPPGRPDGFGTGLSVLTIGAFDLEPYLSSVTWDQATPGYKRYLTSGGPLTHLVQLPSGAVVEKIELEACDSTNLGDVRAGFGSQAVPSGAISVHGFVLTGVPETPGCAVFPHTLATPTTIDNGNFTYLVDLLNTTADGTTSLVAIRIYYRLQVSPAPGAATFSDVPVSHPYFRFVEALAASGITAGCGGGNFCPERNITRGEIAVFFSKALGLHFPNSSETGGGEPRPYEL